MLQITKQGNSIVVKGLDHALYPYSGTLEIPCNSVITVVDEGDIVTFRAASNYDVLFSGLVSEITINGEAVTKENVGDKFGAISNTSSGGGGGLTPEQEERLNNAVQIANYNADKEAQATIDESQNAAIEGLSGDLEGKQDKIDDLDSIRDGAAKGASAIQEETDPLWNSEKGNYYTKGETDGLVNEAKASANTAISIASSAEGIATAAHSMADEALEELKNKADKTEIPSLDGYATEEWVEGKGYLTEHQDISGKLDKTEAAETYQPKGDYALKNDLEGYVDVETYNQHITDQTAVDEAQNSAIEGIEGDISRIDSKIDDIELFKFPNATIIGEPTIQSGQVSNFSTDNYLQFPFVLDLHNQAFQIDFCFTTSTDVSGQQNVLDSKFGIALAVNNGKGLMAISSNGTSWNIGSIAGTMNIEPNTTYYARLSWDGIQYKTMLSTDGTEYTQDMVLVGAQRPFPTNIYIGGCDLSATGHESHPFKGTINMNKAQLTVMGNVVWQGMDDAGLATRLATNLNNIDEVGIERLNELVNLKTINGESIKGEGDITIGGGGLDPRKILYMRLDEDSDQFKFYPLDGTGYSPNVESIFHDTVYIKLYKNDGSYDSKVLSKTSNRFYLSKSGIDITQYHKWNISYTDLSSSERLYSFDFSGTFSTSNKGGGGDETDPIWTAEKVNYSTTAEMNVELEKKQDKLTNTTTMEVTYEDGSTETITLYKA